MTLTTEIGNEVQGCHHKIMQWKPQRTSRSEPLTDQGLDDIHKDCGNHKFI